MDNCTFYMSPMSGKPLFEEAAEVLSFYLMGPQSWLLCHALDPKTCFDQPWRLGESGNWSHQYLPRIGLMVQIFGTTHCQAGLKNRGFLISLYCSPYWGGTFWLLRYTQPGRFHSSPTLNIGCSLPYIKIHKIHQEQQKYINSNNA